MMRITRARWLLAVFTALLMVLSACGSGDDDTSSETTAAVSIATTTATTVAVETVDVVAVADDFLVSMPEGFLNVGDVEAFKTAVDTGGAYVIDVREPSEYAEGHIPGAVNIPIRELSTSLDAIPADQPVIVYCASGYRAGMAATSLQMLGYDNVKAFAASYKGWTAAGEETSTETVEPVTVVAPAIAPELQASVDEFLTLMPEGYLALGSVEKMQSAMDAGAFVIDVRETAEFTEGHLPDATSIPLRTLVEQLAEIPADTQAVVYCQSGYRASIANATLGIVGLNNVVAFPPSYKGWTEAGLEIET